MSGVVTIKTILSEEGNLVLQSLPRNFSYVVVEESESQSQESDNVKSESDRCITIRCSIASVAECQSWLDDFQQSTLTRWIIARCVNEPMR